MFPLPLRTGIKRSVYFPEITEYSGEEIPMIYSQE